MRVIKTLFRVVRWPVAVRAGALFIAIIGVTGIVIGFVDPSGLAKRGIPNSTPVDVMFLAAGILGAIGLRIFAWLTSLLLAFFALLAVSEFFRSDLGGALIVFLWIVLLIAPVVFACIAEVKRGRTPNPPSPS